MMKQRMTAALGTLLVGSLLFSSPLFAEPSSNVVWDAETRNLLENADLEKGKKSAMACMGCHGMDNTAQTAPDIPLLFGQPAGAIYKQLTDYKDQKRQHPLMQFYASSLSKEDIANIAAFYEQQNLPVAKVEADKVTDAAKRLARKGDGERLLAPCAACHGSKGEGNAIDLPALAGQNPRYFEVTLKAFQEGKRANDLYSRMRLIAAALTEQEIKELADYYASIGLEAETETEAEK